MPRIILYRREDCHLCEVALELIADGLDGVDLALVDIDADPALAERYDDRVPVLQRSDTGAELGWPFDLATLSAFLSA